jgi:hypothetical protein
MSSAFVKFQQNLASQVIFSQNVQYGMSVDILFGVIEFKIKTQFIFTSITFLVYKYYIQSATVSCGQTWGTSSTYQNKKKCPYQHVSGNI